MVLPNFVLRIDKTPRIEKIFFGHSGFGPVCAVLRTENLDI